MEVQQENKVLIKKMLFIESKQGDLGHKMFAKTPSLVASLNRITRLRELTKVNHENQNLLKRLRNTQSNYDIRVLEKNQFEQQTLMENLCRNSSKCFV